MVVAIASSTVHASDSSGSSSDSEGGPKFALAFTIGAGMVFIRNEPNRGVYRGPVSLELVPSIGWSWFKFDLGLSTTLESIKVAGTKVGLWNFTFRPGGRFTPPMIPLYLRVAFPLQIQRHDFDWGLMFGLGADIRVFGPLGIVIEVDTTLTNRLEWGVRGVPLEFRAGVSLHF
jgi:hypothetical protein